MGIDDDEMGLQLELELEIDLGDSIDRGVGLSLGLSRCATAFAPEGDCCSTKTS
jgi:hypothetical protein